MKTKIYLLLLGTGLCLTLGLSACTNNSTKEFQEQQNNLFQPNPQGTPTFKADTTATDSTQPGDPE